MKKIIGIFFLLIGLVSYSQQKGEKKEFTSLFETSNGTETPQYKDVIAFYKQLSTSHKEISIFEIGETDIGKPLHLVVFNSDGNSSIQSLKESTKTRILINNGIHPGESDGIDASMLLLRDITQNGSLKKKYQNVLIGIIPVYNIGGALQRNSHTRANQNGPKEYGFRGNTRNYDLNRDFIKQDTKNAATFAKIFHLLDPDIFIDNHVSNGADYQYAITHLFTQHNKLGGTLGVYLEKEMRPYIEQSLAQKSIDITPYVNVWGSTPEKGWTQFYDTPRYSTGYTSLFNTLGLMVETHMLKPYKIRVEQTYELLFSTLDFAVKEQINIKKIRTNALKQWLNTTSYPIAFSPDKNTPSTLSFKGYKAIYKESKITSGKRLFYDRTKPYTFPVSYYNNFLATKKVTIPKAYLLKQGWYRVVERLENNHIKFSRLKKDTLIKVTVQYIADYKTKKQAYEGHYLHHDTKVKKVTKNIQFKKGDIIIPTKQKGIRYIIETLEAAATDSFFNWNFFDTILQRKEGFSAYVFEDIAAEILAENPAIKKQLDDKINTDKKFASNPYEQLNFIYKQSAHYEKVHLRLPVFKLY